MAKLKFNAAEVEVSEFMAIPTGWYAAEITDSEMKDTKSGNGQYLQITIKIIEGEHSGRLLFDRMNLINPNQTAVSIAQQTLASICNAVGLDKIEDSAELHGKPLNVSVTQVDDRDYGDANGKKNEIKGYSSLGKPGATATKTQAAEASAERPW